MVKKRLYEPLAAVDRERLRAERRKETIRDAVRLCIVAAILYLILFLAGAV